MSVANELDSGIAFDTCEVLLKSLVANDRVYSPKCLVARVATGSITFSVRFGAAIATTRAHGALVVELDDVLQVHCAIHLAIAAMKCSHGGEEKRSRENHKEAGRTTACDAATGATARILKFRAQMVMVMMMIIIMYVESCACYTLTALWLPSGMLNHVRVTPLLRFGYPAAC